MKETHNSPALHNAMWPGLVGKGVGSEPPIDLETMLNLTANARVDGHRFEGVDLFLSLPHTDIDSSDDDLARLAEKVASKELLVGSLVAPVWAATGGGSARRRGGEAPVSDTSRKGVHRPQASRSRHSQVRHHPHRFGREPADWAKDPTRNTERIAQTFREACSIAEEFGERLAAEGEICWGGMHSWRRNLELMELVDRPKIFGFQADMAHTMLFTMGFNAPEDRLLPENFDWSRQLELALAYRKMAGSLRPWTTDFHVAQNDGTVKGEGSHDKTGRHCQPSIPMESSISSGTPARGCGMTTEMQRVRSRTFVGTAACSRM